MSELLIKDKEIAVPGECLANGMDYLPGFGTYRDKECIRSARLGLASIDGRAIKIIPLSGKYSPKKGDTIIGKVQDVLMSAWRIDTFSAYTAMFGLKEASSEFIPNGVDLTRFYDFGDYIVTKIINVTPQKLIDLTMKGPGLRKLQGGRIMHVNCNKVPRIIGKKGSMVSMIKQATDCRIVVGQNGIVWILGEDPKSELLAVETIQKIEREAHISGLTDRIKLFLEEKTGRQIEIQQSNEMGGEQNDIR
jgi:exosome complex component RRP4